MVFCRFRTNSSDTPQMAYLPEPWTDLQVQWCLSVFSIYPRTHLWSWPAHFSSWEGRPFSAGRCLRRFWLSSHGFNSSSKIFLRNSSTISAARFCISLVVWVGVLGERRPGMSQDSRQSLYIYTRCQRMGGKSVVQTMKPDIRQLRPF